MKARALGAGPALTLAACGSDAGGGGDNGGGGGGSADSHGGAVPLTFWHNSSTGEGRQYWDDLAAAFEEENEGVTIEIQAIQNEDMDGKLQTALNSGDAPAVLMARGGRKLTDVGEVDMVRGLTDLIHPDTTRAP